MLNSISLKNDFNEYIIDRHITDLLEILDIKVLRLLIKIQNTCIESSQTGFSMSFVDIFNQFVNRKELTESEELQQLKNGYITKEIQSKNKGYLSNLDILFKKFSLSWLEQNILIMSLAVELDPKYEKVFGLIADDISVKYPTIETVLKILFDNSNEYLKYKKEWISGGNLQKYLLSDSPWNYYNQNKEICLDQRIVYYIMRIDSYSKDIENYINIFNPSIQLETLLVKKDLQKELKSYYNDNMNNKKSILISLEGEEGTGRTFQLKHLCQSNNKKLIIVDMNLFSTDIKLESLIKHILCEKIIQNAILALKISEKIEDKIIIGLKKLIGEFLKQFPYGEVLYIVTDDSLNKYQIGKNNKYVDYFFDLPTENERKVIWENLSKKYKFNSKINWGEFASKFRFTPGQIKNTLKLSSINIDKSKEISVDNLIKACYQNGKSYLITKARKIEAKYKWKDIILPKDSKDLLRAACNQIKYKQTVFGEWGFNKKFSYGKGLSILFSGPPGTGKTMSAQVVANELKLELYKVDIANLVSKYIGETEKNLEGIFDEASLSNAILFFDEADSVFGKRTEVKDSHDKHANVETSYLLQKIEEYEGITILATNYLKNIDEAFLRRFNFVIEFPFPDANYREMIWKSIFPKETPIQEDMDFSLIAEKFEISGGNIKNIVLSAAFIAAEANESIGTYHIVKAARNELNKIGKLIVLNDMEEYL